jgi:hypothetical protein
MRHPDRLANARENGPRNRRDARLTDIRQIGPKGERDISGVCSSCGTILLARLDISESATPANLREKLETVFKIHLTEKHPDSPS